MAVGRIFTGKRLSLAIAFGVLLAAAFGAGCNGFFVPNTLTAVTIQPVSPSIQVGQSQTLQAWGTYQDNTRSQITSGAEWTSSDTTIMTIGQTTGLATAVDGGTSTITVSAQGLSATATATAYFGTISNYQVCQGSFGSTSGCSSGSSPLSISTTTTGSVNLIAQGTYVNSSGQSTTVDLTTTSTFTPSNTSALTCTNTTSPAVCTVQSGTASGTVVSISVTYGTVNSATVNLTIS